MARLSDYGINVDQLSNKTTVLIRGREFPVAFTMETMEFIADCYAGDYSIFEKDMNAMLEKSSGRLTSGSLASGDLKIMRSLIYGMLRTGGLEENVETIMALLGMGNDVLKVYATCMEIFTNQAFQVEDLKKSKKPQDFQKQSKKGSKKKKYKR